MSSEPLLDVTIGDILGGQRASDWFKSYEHVRIGILVDRQTCRGVLHEDIQQADQRGPTRAGPRRPDR